MLENVVTLQPSDTLSAQLLSKLRPASPNAVATTPSTPAPPRDPGKLAGRWVAQPPNATITLTIKPDSAFDWACQGSGKPPVTISGSSSLADGVLTLIGDKSSAGNLAGNVVWQDDSHFGFRTLGAPSDDPGLQFHR